MTSNNTTKISICSSALLRIGADEITSFEDETRESKLCNADYEQTVRNCLSSRRWGFAKKQVQLNRLTQTPLYKYKYAFQLPTDFISFAGKNNPQFRHEVQGNHIYCDASEIELCYIFRAREEDFPPYFTEYLILCFCSKFSMSLLEDVQKSNYYKSLETEQMRKAMSVDGQNSTNKVMPLRNFSIVAVRYG